MVHMTRNRSNGIFPTLIHMGAMRGSPPNGERGFHEAAISRITARAGVAIGSFYTYFDSKEALFTELVRDLTGQVRDFVAPRLAEVTGGIAIEKAGQAAFLEFARAHKEIYRIIDEAEFVDPAGYRAHYTRTAERIGRRLDAAIARGEISPGSSEIRAWALMGMNVFLGLRFGVWSDDLPVEDVVAVTGDLLVNGLAPLERFPHELNRRGFPLGA
jgi:AcrR family transcriptional regulator